MHFLTEAILKVAAANQQPIQPDNYVTVGADSKKVTLQQRMKQMKCCEGM